MNHRPKALAGVAEFADGVAQHFFEVRAEPERIGHQVDFPQPVLGAADRSLQAGFGGIQGRLGALEVADVDDGAGDAHDLAGWAARYGGFLADPALLAAVERHAVFAAIRGLLGSGIERGTAGAHDIVLMNPRQQEIQIVELGRRRDAQQGVEIIRTDPGVAAKVEVEGGEPGRGLRHVQRLGGAAQLLFQLLALGDVADGADGAGGTAFRVVQHLPAVREPAHVAVRQQRAVFAFVPGAGVDGGAQGEHHAFQIFRVNGRHPFVALQGQVATGQSDELEEQGGAADVPGREVHVKHAEATGDLGKLENFAAVSARRLLQAIQIAAIRRSAHAASRLNGDLKSRLSAGSAAA
jgi:hypothetical protein